MTTLPFLSARLGRVLVTLLAVSPAGMFSANPTHVPAPLPTMSSSPQYTLVDVPARIAGLAFNFLQATNFNALELPEETPDFEQPAVFMPLHVVMASYGAVLFSVGARPAYGYGTVEDWAGFLARELCGDLRKRRPRWT